jgi:hypothetical protein
MTEKMEFVIPAYGDAPFISETLKSLAGQELQAPRRVRWVRRPVTVDPTSETVETQEALGIGGDWEAALKLSERPWVCLAHSDDIYLAEYSKAVVEAAGIFPEAAIIFTDSGYLHSGWKHALLRWIKRRLNPAVRWSVFGSSGKPRLIQPKTMLKALRWGCFVPCPTVTYRYRAVRQALNGDLFSRDLKTTLDWMAWVRIAKAGLPFVYIPRELVRLRVHQEATTQKTIQDGARSREEMQVLEQLWGTMPAAILRVLLRAGQRLQKI